MRKILITNDDGINAGGLIRLAKAAKEFGEVWVVAPEKQRSAISHAITLHKDIEAWEVSFPVEGVHAYACDGMPADCIRIGVLNIVPGGPDNVFCGINYGVNVANDIQYSATIAAAMEAAFQKIHAIAFSEDFSDNTAVTEKYLKEIIGDLLNKPLLMNEIWNVNFPCCDLSDFKGIINDAKVSKEVYYHDHYNEKKLENGHVAYTIEGVRNYDAEDGTDLWAVLNDHISVGKVENIG